MIDGTSAYNLTEFEYLTDSDPLTGAPTITAVPKTVGAARAGVAYNVINDLGDLFKRENLREAWRVMRRNDPFDYQIAIADAILFSALQGLGWFFVVMISRQAGKNEISAFVQQYILLYGWYYGLPVSGVKFAPVYKPQVQASMDRLEGAATADSGGLAGCVITRKRFKKSDGYKFHIGPPRDTNKWAFLSINPSANVASQTAFTLLEGDEAQDIDANKWNKDAAPMVNFKNATTVLWGVAWTKDSFIYQGMQQAYSMEERLKAQLGYKPKLVFKIDADAVVASGNDAYKTAYENQVARLGKDHIAILTQYRLQFVDAVGKFFSPEQTARVYANTFKMRVSPEPGKVYVFAVDVAGQEEEITTTAEAEIGKHKRDALVLIIGELQKDGTVVPVCFYQWVGKSHTKVRALLPKIIRNHWGCVGGVCDATGIGEPLAYFLKETLDANNEGLVEAYKFKGAGDENKSKLGYLAYDMVHNDLLKIPREPVGDDEQAELWREARYQLENLIREAKKQQYINWYVPQNAPPRFPGHVPHDDIITGIFLLMRAAYIIRNPEARKATAFDRSAAGV